MQTFSQKQTANQSIDFASSKTHNRVFFDQDKEIRSILYSKNLNTQRVVHRMPTNNNKRPEDDEAEVKPNAGDLPISSGQPIDHNTRTFFEPRFGHDFSQVRVHKDAKAAESARAISAVAYTIGRDIVFGAGKSPGSDVLTAHELTHVLQQTGHNDPNAVRASAMPSFIIQRQCQGDVGTPTSYGTNAAGTNLHCTEANTGISDADVTNWITQGRRRARVMIDDALTVLNRMITNRPASADALTHFRRLFRLADPQPTNAQIRQAIAIYNSICSWLISPSSASGNGILCLTQGTGSCRGQYFGMANCTTGTTTRQPIMLCPDGIFSDSLQTAETIIHEAAHRFGICTTPPQATAPSPPERYEGEPSFPTSPALRTSADSYSAFAREAHSLRGRERVADQQRQEAAEGITERPILPLRR